MLNRTIDIDNTLCNQIMTIND